MSLIRTIRRKLRKAADRARQRVRRALNVESLQQHNALRAEVRALKDELMRYATMDVDMQIHPRGNSTVVLIGQYRGRAYVQFYDVTSAAFPEVVDHVRFLARDRQARAVDAPPAARYVFDREFL